MYEYLSSCYWCFLRACAVGCCLAGSWGLAFAVVVSPKYPPAFTPNAATFTPSGGSPVVGGLTPKVGAAVDVAGATRYIPVAHRAAAGAVQALRWGVFRNPLVLVGTTALAWYASRGLPLVDGTLRETPGPIDVYWDSAGWGGYQSALLKRACNGQFTRLSEFRQCIDRSVADYDASHLSSWTHDYKCVDGTVGKEAYADLSCTVKIWSVYWLSNIADATVYAGPKVDRRTQDQALFPSATFDRIPSELPPLDDVPVPLPLDPVLVNPTSAGVAQPFQFRIGDSEALANGSFNTTVCAVDGQGTSFAPGLINISCSVVNSPEASALTDAKSPIGSSVLGNEPLVNPTADSNPDVSVGKDGADGKDGLDGKDGADGEDASPLCDLFPDSAACAELDDVDAEDLAKKDIGLELGRWGTWGGSGTCPADVTIRSGVVWSYAPLCKYLGYLRPVLIAVAWLTAAFIVVGARSGGSD